MGTPLAALCLVPAYHQRVWGGQRLAAIAGQVPDRETPLGEAWLVYEHNRICGGPADGRTLAELVTEHGAALLGHRVVARTGDRFPLLIKLLDTSDWLSVQVHPDDARAVALEGPGHFGKTEAWHILETAPDARVIAGLRPGVSSSDLEQALHTGTVVDRAEMLPVLPGDTIFISAGTIHALGPGIFLYEVQQSSDLTYRVFDWNRPPAAGRPLHLDKSFAVADLAARGEARHSPPPGDGEQARLTGCEYFTLRLLTGETRTLALDTRGETFHAITVIAGQARLQGSGWSKTLGPFATAIVPASAGAYTVEPQGSYRALCASVE